MSRAEKSFDPLPYAPKLEGYVQEVNQRRAIRGLERKLETDRALDHSAQKLVYLPDAFGFIPVFVQALRAAQGSPPRSPAPCSRTLYSREHSATVSGRSPGRNVHKTRAVSTEIARQQQSASSWAETSVDTAGQLDHAAPPRQKKNAQCVKSILKTATPGLLWPGHLLPSRTQPRVPSRAVTALSRCVSVVHILTKGRTEPLKSPVLAKQVVQVVTYLY